MREWYIRHIRNILRLRFTLRISLHIWSCVKVRPFKRLRSFFSFQKRWQIRIVASKDFSLPQFDQLAQVATGHWLLVTERRFTQNKSTYIQKRWQIRIVESNNFSEFDQLATGLWLLITERWFITGRVLLYVAFPEKRKVCEKKPALRKENASRWSTTVLHDHRLRPLYHHLNFLATN